MSSIVIGFIAFIFAFGGAMLGLYLRNILPEHHLSKESRDAVMMGTGLIATLTALVLGLLISSAKQSFDSMNASLTESGAKIIMLDRTLRDYGPQADQTRKVLCNTVSRAIAKVWPEHNVTQNELKAFENSPVGMEIIEDQVRNLVPANDSQRIVQTRALQLTNELLETRWLTIERAQGSLPTAFLVILFFWLIILFICIGLFAPANKTVISIMLVCAISVAGAVFLIREMNNPLQGVMKISSAPLSKAVELLGK